MMYSIPISFLSKIEIAVFSVVVMIASSIALYDGKMAKVKSELTTVFNMSTPIKLDLMEHYANTGQWPSSQFTAHTLAEIKAPIIEKTSTNPDGSFQFLLHSPYKEINQKIVRFDRLSEINPTALPAFTWQCRFYDRPTTSFTDNLQMITEGNYIPYLCRD